MLRHPSVLARCNVAALVVVFGALGGEAARAQQTPRNLHFDLQSFHGAATAGGLLSLEGTEIGMHLVPRVGLNLTYQRQPLVYEAFGTKTDAVANRFAGELWASIGFLNRLELGLALPVVFYQNGDAGSFGTAVAKGGLGDLRVVPKVRLFGNGLKGLSMALLAELRIPTARDDSTAGGGFTFEPRLSLGYRYRPLSAHLNFGYRLQPARELFTLAVDDQLLFGLGVQYRIVKPLAALAELTVAAAAAAPFSDSQRTPGQAMFGLRYSIGDFAVTAAAGPGLIGGYGSPAVQALASVTYDPGGVDADGDRIRDADDQCPLDPEDRDGFQDRDGCPDPDNDGDGILDLRDKCPNEPEDKDGFQDEDGCPDPDNDKDGVPDRDDKCPLEPEDKDGFEDQDGCPDPDNDKDGILDKDDKCPNEPEVFNGVEDKDGCPEPDKDADGILDQDDKCPTEPEDKNGVEDDDGCPDDPDKDKIYGDKDRCPNEPETVNGYQDDDGCPDDPTPKAVIRKDSIWTSEAIYFDFDSWHVKGRFRPMLRKVAQAIIEAKTIHVVYVEGHADQRGNEAYNQWLSFNRAMNVVRVLREMGVPRTKLRGVGWGLQRPWDTNQTTEGMARNRRVLFHVEYKSDRVKRTDGEKTGPEKKDAPKKTGDAK
ncbi:MAG: OmpA family protein [Deltaproteobacteria bacterium]|nr:OmpA family protein [Deltaproteobacteria bacterium]